MTYEYAIRTLKREVTSTRRFAQHQRNVPGKPELWKDREKELEEAIKILQSTVKEGM